MTQQRSHQDSDEELYWTRLKMRMFVSHEISRLAMSPAARGEVQGTKSHTGERNFAQHLSWGRVLVHAQGHASKSTPSLPLFRHVRFRSARSPRPWEASNHRHGCGRCNDRRSVERTQDLFSSRFEEFPAIRNIRRQVQTLSNRIPAGRRLTMF